MAVLAVFLPLLGSFLSILLGRILGPRYSEIITTLLVAFASLFSIIIYISIKENQTDHSIYLIQWIESGSLKVNWGIYIDRLSSIMLVVVNLVSFLVHLYSIGYMHNDPNRVRFFTYLSLFTFSMLILVSADNFVQLFFGWEGVGLCSYLLIGFWYKKTTANSAALKAFLVNRVSDIALVISLAIIYFTFDTLVFENIFLATEKFSNDYTHFLGIDIHLLTLISLLLFLGAMGKSAQLGLHTWLPDAMEGPTPVSALIHAATMVTAGVFLVARCSPIFEQSDFTLTFVIIVGGLTSIFAASIALVQNDIKRIIAYSTCSQLGYMFLACGVSAYGIGMFHLVTHAFFKALLFLAAGSVIHALSDEQNIQKMGGLKKYLPKTHIIFWIGSLALAGIPPLSGYASKDLILEAAFVSDNFYGLLAFWFGVITAILTAFYSWRIIYLAFYKNLNLEKDSLPFKIHEAPLVMLLPMYLLAFGAIFSGWIFYDITSLDLNYWQEYNIIANESILDKIHHIPVWVKYIPIVAAMLGIFIATLLYIVYIGVPQIIKEMFNKFYIIFYNKYYFDELYEFIIINPAKAISKFLWDKIDVLAIDKYGPNGMAYIVMNLARKFRYIQTGKIYDYATFMLLGLFLIAFWRVFMLFGQTL